MANIIDSNPLRALDANGDPVSGARLYIYDTGTTSLQTVYTDSALTTPASQPIVANSNGVWAPVYHSGSTNVHITATDTDGNVLPGFPIDPAQSIPLSSSGASQVSFSPTASIAATTVQGAIEEVAEDALQNIVEDTTPQLGGPLDTNSQQIRQSKGADIASDGTLTLGNDGNSFDITGTTTITAIAAKAVGTVAVLQFDDALTLTHHATDLILPGAANITTAAGDIAVFTEYASGDWRCVSYTRADGKPVVPSGDWVWTKATPTTTSGAPPFDYTSIPSDVSEIMVIFDDVSLTGTDDMLVQIGNGGTPTTTGYKSASEGTKSTSGFIVKNANNGREFSGTMWLYEITSNRWVSSHAIGGYDTSSSTNSSEGGGVLSLGAELDMIRLTRTGSNTFDGGQITIWYKRGS